MLSTILAVLFQLIGAVCGFPVAFVFDLRDLISGNIAESRSVGCGNNVIAIIVHYAQQFFCRIRPKRRIITPFRIFQIFVSQWF
jgi:hypothetical protein